MHMNFEVYFHLAWFNHHISNEILIPWIIVLNVNTCSFLLNNNYQSSPHEYRVCRSYIVRGYAISGTYRRTLVSPANLVRVITMSKNRIKPWDIPDLACAKFDSLPPLFVVFQWAMKISNVHFCQIFHVLGFPNLLWGTESNALLKSKINDIDWMALI